jgi:hypothetical protein
VTKPAGPVFADPERLPEPRARVIAFYLPQFHPIPENDAWWGPGFTEWINVAAARPLFRGHVQPHLPSELGFYDLRLDEVREQQAALARLHGIEGFCYWHYWFGGRLILERPFEEVLGSGSPRFPFMLGWANQTWSGIWHGEPDRVLIEQTYPGLDDHERHLRYLLEAFRDPRYIRIDGKPAFYVYRPREIPDVLEMTTLWRRIAREAGLPGLYLLAEDMLVDRARGPIHGFDATVQVNLPRFLLRGPRRRLERWIHRGVVVHDYETWLPRFVTEDVSRHDVHPCAIPNWDNTPRSGRRGMVLAGSSPRSFGLQVRRACELVADKPRELRLIFAKSWNEWAEGNYLEPDREHGRAYLEALASEILSERLPSTGPPTVGAALTASGPGPEATWTSNRG